MLKVLHSMPTMSTIKKEREPSWGSTWFKLWCFLGMFQSYHVVLRIVRSGSQLNERCVEDETKLKQWQCRLNARKSTVHNSSLLKLRPKSLANLSNIPFLNVHVQCLRWRKTDWQLNDAKFWNTQKTMLLDCSFCIFWDDTNIDSPHLTRFSTLSLLTILSTGNAACSLVKSPFDVATLSTAG